MPKVLFPGRFALALALVVGTLVAGPAQGAYLNYTAPGAGPATLNGAVFIQGATLSGTGVFPAFVQIDGSGPGTVKEAYNTTVNNVLNNGSSDTFNHEITVSQLPIVTLNGVQYYSFFLDINEANNNVDKYLSLDMLQIYTSNTPNQSTTNPSTLGTLRYDMGTGNGVLLNFDLEPGSGRADLEVLIPVWANPNPNDYVYLYSKFGVLGVLGPGNPYGAPPGDYGTSDGFEEWALGRGGVEIPEPSSILLAGAAFVGLGGFAGWRRRRAAK